jgi:hypothetical protein
MCTETIWSIQFYMQKNRFNSTWLWLFDGMKVKFDNSNEQRIILVYLFCLQFLYLSLEAQRYLEEWHKFYAVTVSPCVP